MLCCCVARNCAAGRAVILQCYLAVFTDIDAAAVAVGSGRFVCLVRTCAADSAAADCYGGGGAFNLFRIDTAAVLCGVPRKGAVCDVSSCTLNI